MKATVPPALAVSNVQMFHRFADPLLRSSYAHDINFISHIIKRQILQRMCKIENVYTYKKGNEQKMEIRLQLNLHLFRCTEYN